MVKVISFFSDNIFCVCQRFVCFLPLELWSLFCTQMNNFLVWNGIFSGNNCQKWSGKWTKFLEKSRKNNSGKKWEPCHQAQRKKWVRFFLSFSVVQVYPRHQVDLCRATNLNRTFLRCLRLPNSELSLKTYVLRDICLPVFSSLLCLDIFVEFCDRGGKTRHDWWCIGRQRE